jgi:orotate phosphoribosyltransferase
MMTPLIEFLVAAYQRYETPVRLKSGKLSNEYLNASFTTRNPRAQVQVAEAVMAKMPRDVDAIGGPTMGADPIAASVSMRSVYTTKPIPWFSVRMAGKDHGTGEWIEGPVTPGMYVVIVDDVITTGGSLLHVVQKCLDFGLKVGGIVTLVDRMASEDRMSFIGKLHDLAGPQSHFWTCHTLQEIRYSYDRAQGLTPVRDSAILAT